MSGDEKHDEEQARHIPKNNVANESPLYNELSFTFDLSQTATDYADCSQLNVKEMLKHRPGTRSKETFPTKLHTILSNPQYRNIISWLQHGRSWKVLDPKRFQEEIVPKYFRHRKLSSFMRQVNGWGFYRANEGVDHNSYYHEVSLFTVRH